MKTALTIAGSDCSGGAGIQADLKTMTMCGVYAMSVITALTAQNTTGVRSILDVPEDFLADQLDAVFEDIFPDAVKIGMVSSPGIVRVIGEKLRQYGAKNVVLDPVMVAASGSKLIKTEAVEALVSDLFPLCTLVTPNIPEAEALAGFPIKSEADMVKAAEKIGKASGVSVLVKGGHALSEANDVLYSGGSLQWLRGERIDNPNTHGTGCTLSSAIASHLALGKPLPEAVRAAKRYLTGALEAQLNLGRGSGPLDHGYLLRRA